MLKVLIDPSKCMENRKHKSMWNYKKTVMPSCRTFCPMPTMTPWWRGRPTMEGKTARGASSPANPALTMPDPLSTTNALISPSSICVGESGSCSRVSQDVARCSARRLHAQATRAKYKHNISCPCMLFFAQPRALLLHPHSNKAVDFRFENAVRCPARTFKFPD